MGKILSQSDLKNFCRQEKQQNRKLVFTNGVFDLLHRGHVEYLNAARALGDVLIVGMNSDRSVRRIKGDKKPLIPEEDRAFILSNLVSVDAVCLFEEETPQKLIEQIVPDILVKGGDYEVGQIVGKEIVEKNGGQVVTIPLTGGKSTTRLIQLILERFRETKI